MSAWSQHACASSMVRGRLWRVVRCAPVLVLLGFVVACGRVTPRPVPAPTPTVAIRHRDAQLFLLRADDLGPGYHLVETGRLERGRGWGEDTTRLSGYRTVFEGGGDVFSRLVCQVECYLSVADGQEAYLAYLAALPAQLDGDPVYGSVADHEERALGDWNRVFVARAEGVEIVHVLFLRENVFVDLAFTGTGAPQTIDLAARQARLVDERIFAR